MTGVALVAAAALLMGAASGASITGRSPYWLGDDGGVIVTVFGEGFSDDQFSQFDPSLGNRVYLVNGEDEIECEVIRYLTTASRIVCASGPRSKPSAARVYSIIVYVDGVRAAGAVGTMQYGWWTAPKMTTVTPRWSLPGAVVTFNGWFTTDKYYKLDFDDPLETDAEAGQILTKVFLGGVECDMLDEDEELLGTFTENTLTCQSRAKLIGAMNTSIFVTDRGSSVNDKSGMYVDSQDKLFQFHTYPGVNSVSPGGGSTAGGSLITINGVGFDPYKEQTKVEVGGAECVIQQVTDDQIQCLAPSQDMTSPGPGERGLLVELYEGEYFEAEFNTEESWTALSPAHPGYRSFVTDVNEFQFSIDITQDTVGTVKGYLHPPHDGMYSFHVSTGDHNVIMVAADGNPNNKGKVKHWEHVLLQKSSPVYMEMRIRSRAAMEFKLYMNDLNSKFVNSQTNRARNEKHRLRFDIREVHEEQKIVIEGEPADVTLFMNGISSSPVDIADAVQVREQLLDMTQQKCEADFSGLDVLHYNDFEDDTRPPGCRGDFVDIVTPFCGRKIFRLERSDPRIYRETDESLMVDANVHRYLCFAVSGNLETSMAINFVWRNNDGQKKDKTYWFERKFSSDSLSWAYWCEDLVQVMLSKVDASQFTEGNMLKIKNIVLPKPVKPTDDVYVDEVVFLSTATSVLQTRPSALKQQGILVQDVEVRNAAEDGYSLRFVTSNCMAGMPLLGVFEGGADNSFIEVLKDAQSYDFSIGEAVVKINRETPATSPLGGTWDLSIQGQLVKDIAADVHPSILESFLESALGTDLAVYYRGGCRNYYYDVEWLQEPGIKEVAVLDDANLEFDGVETLATASRVQEGSILHYPLPADFMTTYRDSPHVTVRVNGYSAVCSGGCAFTYDDATTPTLNSVSGTPGEGLQHTLTLTGTGFTSSSLDDYSVSVGDWPCSPTAVTTTQVICEVSVWGGQHPVAVSMQPAGVALTPSPVAYTVAVTVTDLSIATGGTGGLYPITVSGSGFPDGAGWEAGSAKVMMGNKECVVTSGSPTEVTCTVPAGEGAVDVEVIVGGTTSDTLASSFTYDASLSPAITDTSIPALCVYGQEELTVTGSSFGASGSVKIGSESCDVTSWSDTSVTCLTPSFPPGAYALTLLADSMGAASTGVEYVLQVTSASAARGSVKGGTLMKVGGMGFGADCSRLEVKLGEQYECEVLDCSPEALTCATKVVPSTHKITNTGSTSATSVSWSPLVVEVVEGDEVTWQWSKLSENSQLEYSVCEVASPVDACEDGDGLGFTSGPQTASGSFTVKFPQQGTYYYASLPLSSGGLVMRGQINVVRPQHQALKVTVTLAGKEATYEVTGDEVVSVSGCDPIVESPIDGCDVADPTTPEDGHLYFQAHTCYTPVVQSVATSTTHNVPGLSGVQVLGGESLTITGSGFGDLSCQVEVKVGDAACTVTSISDTSVTCDLDDLDNLRSSAYLPFTVKVTNRGMAAHNIDNHNSAGRVVVVPEVSSLTPPQGSLAGGTLLTITGTGLQGVSAEPVVLLGGKPCQLQSVSSTTVTCLTPASASAASATLTLAVLGVPAKMEALTFTYTEALTPVVTGMSVEGELVTLSGQRFGADASKLTVTLERQTASSRRQDMHEEEEEEEEKNDLMKEQEEEDELMMEEEEIDAEYLEIFEDDEELLYMANGYMDEEMADAIHRERSQRHLRRRLKLSLVDELEVPEGFWGTFTGTGAATFEETVRMGAWRMAGTAPVPKTEDDEGLRETLTRKKRSAEDLPTSYSCTVTSASGSEVSCTCSGLPAGSYTPVMSLDGAGKALAEGVSDASIAVIASMTPASGSTNGGALLALTGSGFIPGDTSVLVGGVACVIEEESANGVSCRVAPGSEGSAAVVVKVTGSEDVTASSQFMYSSAFTPTVTSITPSEGVVAGDTLTLIGTGFALSDADPVVTLGGQGCTLTSQSETSLECTAPEVGGGSYEVVVRDSSHGDSSPYTVTFTVSIVSMTPSSGSFGGAEVIVTGQGFDPAGRSTVTICDKSCDVTATTSTTTITCLAPRQDLGDTTLGCDVVVAIPEGPSFTLPGGFSYNPALTPSLASVEPKRGGTAGGTPLTLMGTGFVSSGNVVTIDGSPCLVTSEGSSSITCTTGAHQGSGRFEVKVTVPGSGLATTDDNGVFYYIDRWSSVFTWDNEPVPSEGQLAVVTQGQTILLDESTPVLKMLLIQGGHVLFDAESAEELVLRAEYILVVDGGSLSIGSEEEPFMGPAVIELYGNTHSIELPIYGAKVLAVRNGTLDVHGAHVPITWTHLAQTASPGDTTITLALPVTWKAGDKIVIATTEMRFSKNENEVRTIASVSGDGLQVTLTEALEHTHISLTQTLGGRTVETRAEVGLLTRNVKIRGAINSDFTEAIEGCEREFSPGQFKTQSCFNGRYGDEIGSDQFGATVMLSGKYPDQELVTGRLEYVEVTEAGQAFQLGRYPLHFHVVGNVNTSYVRGCAIHRTYNRAVTIHAANNLTVERNVVYDNMGHAIFTEDGVEQNNVVQYNLAVYTRTSSSLLNVDVTPSSYWVVNPNNIFRHNAAAGGTHFGYWYRLERHPSGPSATNAYCPNNEQMGQFFNNTAHSMGRYGLWVFSMDGFIPKSRTCGGSDLVAKWEGFTAWHCDRGAEVVFGRNLQFHDFVMLDNQHAGMEMVKVEGGYGEDDGPGIFNSMVVGHSALGSGSCGDGTSGIVAPKEFIFSIADVTFVNFDTGKCTALSGCSQCKFRQGGFMVQVKGLTFDSSPNKLKFKWEHETVWIDADGSLTGVQEANVVPSMAILPPDSCSDEAAFSINTEVPGAVCNGLKFLRLNMKGPDTEPASLVGRDLIVSNSYGSTFVPYRVKRLTTAGWMWIAYTGDTYDWDFDYSDQITNISYKADTRFLTPGDHFFVRHTFMQEPDGFRTTSDERTSLEALPDPATNVHGDFYWNKDDKELTYMVSYNKASSSRSVVYDERDPGILRKIDFGVYRCKYEGCIPPTPPPVPTGRPDTTFRWSDVETWKEVPVGSGGHPTETEYNLPVEGDEIIIPKGMWLIVDTQTPKLGRVYVYGAIEFEDTMDHDFEATIIYIQGGTVVGGFSSEDPFTHNLVIRLRGSLDPSDPDNEDIPMPEGVPSVGWKAMGVFGYLKLHGQVAEKTWLKLAATAEPGATTITLAEEPDASWLDKMVVVTATAKEATESEVRTVKGISGTTLTLDTALTYQHLGESHTLEDGSSISLAGEVGLLSRNIVVEGNTYQDFEADSFGGRIVVSKLTQDDVDYVGSAQLDGVELRNMGQEGFTDLDDPRYSLAYVGLDTIYPNSSYVKRSSFNLNYNVALGLLGTSGMAVEDNVIYYALDSGIRDESGSNNYTHNLITTVLFLGTYGDREEIQNLNYYGAFHLDKAPNTLLSGNVVAGAEQAGYKTFGEPCEDNTQWTNNEVHTTVFGVMAWKKGAMGALTDCRRINNFYAWRVSSTAFYFQYYASSLLTNVVSVDNRLGVNQLIYTPASLSHVAHPKTATITDSVFVGASPSHSCAFQQSVTDIMTFYDHRLWNKGVDGGNTALVFGSMMSSSNMAPKKPFSPPTSYPALYGSTHIERVTFSNYDDTACGRDIALLAHPDGDDAIHPVFVEDLAFFATPEDNYFFIPRANLGRVNPADCVDMDCDGHKKVVLKDKDGSLLGVSGATVISQAEHEWDGDARHGVGDYRIPVPLRQRDDGSEIEAIDKFPNKGIVRDESCSLVPSWQAWKCTSLSHRMMVIESMDSDTEVRRLSPIALIANPGVNGYVDLINGPMDRGWCFGYTCQERISTFYSVVAADQTYEMAMTSTPPQLLRLHLLHAPPSEAVILRIFFPKPQRYDIYVDDVFVPPTNIDNSVNSYQLIPENPDDPDAFFPTLDHDVGANYFQRSAKLVHVVLRGGHVIDIKTTPMITLSSGLVVSDDDFFEENLLSNLADLFGVSNENIRITNIVREDSAGRKGREATVSAEVTAEVASTPTTSLNGEKEGAMGGEVLSFEDLEKDLQTAVRKFQEGQCEFCSALKVNDPVKPPKEAPPKATPETGSVVTEDGKLYSDKQQEEEAEELEKSLETTEYVQPSSALLLSGVPSETVQYTAFVMQPSVSVLDDEGETVQDLGHSSDPWRLTAQLLGGPEGARLMGTTTVPYIEGAATFLDLSVSEPGEGYNLTFSFTYPSDAPAFPTALNQSFSARSANMAITLQYPPDLLLQAGQPFPLFLQFVDLESQLPLDATLFEGQTIVGEVLARSEDEEFQIVERIYWADGAVSMITFEDFIIPESSVRYQLAAKVSVVPAGWYLQFTSPNMVVYPDYLMVQGGSITKNISTNIYRMSIPDDLLETVEDEMMKLLSSVDMMEEGVYWGPVTVINERRGRVKGTASLTVTGIEDDVDVAIKTLCWKLRKGVRISIPYNCKTIMVKVRYIFINDTYYYRNCKRLIKF